VSAPFYEERLRTLEVRLDLAPRRPEAPTPADEEITASLARWYRAVKARQRDAGSLWQPAGEWQDYHLERRAFYALLERDEVRAAAAWLASFWRNPLGLIVKEYARFEDLAQGKPGAAEAFTRAQGRNYLIWKDLFDQPDEALRVDPTVGNPWGCLINGTFVAPKAIRYRTNAAQIDAATSDLDRRVVAEIGGGYGGLAAFLLAQVGRLTYVNFDLPETLVLCAYYLLATQPRRRIVLLDGGPFEPSLLGAADAILAPHFTIERFPAKSVSLFFNSFSLSEMPPPVNAAYLDQIARLTTHWFFHDNMDRAGVVNRGFERIPASRFPADPRRFVLLAKHYDLFHGHGGDYKEFLYKVL
jgi:putative sugar O-methyltransferase